MPIHLPALKTLGRVCCGTRTNRLLSSLDNTPVVRTSNAKPSGYLGGFVCCGKANQAAKNGCPHSRAELMRQKTRYRRNRLLPQGTQPPTSATQPVAAPTATPVDHHGPSTTSVARRVNAEPKKEIVTTSSQHRVTTHHDALSSRWCIYLCNHLNLMLI